MQLQHLGPSMKNLIAILFAFGLAAQTPPMIPMATGGGPVGGATNLTTVGSVPYVSASGTLDQDAGQFVWDATNNRLGIGTATPSQKLEVAGIGRFTGTGAFSVGDEAGALRITSNNASLQPFGLFNATNGYTGIRVGAISVGTTYASSDAPAAGMIVQGNVGIGTTIPGYALDVSGTINASAAYRISGNLLSDASRNLLIASIYDTGLTNQLMTFGGASVTVKNGISLTVGGTSTFYNATASTGSTLAVFRAGVAQSGNVLEVQNNAGANVLSVTATGALTSAVSILAGGNVNAGATQDLGWSARSTMTSPSSGVIALYNNAQNDFSRLQWGGTTSSFPSIKRNGTALVIRLADDSANAAIQASSYISNDGTTGVTVTTCTGFKNGLCISGT
jgi:hypothetical protein